MSQISDGHLDRFDVLRNDIEQSLEELVASRIHSGEVVELAGKILLAGGKRLRPIMMFLAYELAGGNKPQDLMALAMGFELLHTATLIHDDINDQATHRRGVPTIHTDYGLAKAIIAGDWLFVQGYSLGGRYDQEIVTIIGNYCSEIAVSEFSQIEHINNLRTTPEDYLNIVKGKTAGPFSGGCRAAAVIAGASEEDKIARLDIIRKWENPGPGSFYDDIGNVAKSDQVLRGKPLSEDPLMQTNPNPDFMWWDNGMARVRQAWVSKMDWPIGLQYDHLDKSATYILRTTGYGQCLVRVNSERIYPTIDEKGIGEIKEFFIPKSLYNNGSITLTFDIPHEPEINWRQQSRLSEVWLIKK